MTEADIASWKSVKNISEYMNGRTVETDGIIKPFDRMPKFSGATNGSNAYADILVVSAYGCIHNRFDAPDYESRHSQK